MSGGIEIARRALQANSYVLDTIGNNIANLNTPGYSRQKVSLKPTDPLYISADNANAPFAAIGTGVSIYDVQRMRNEFFDSQMRDVLGNYGSWFQQSITYNTIEGIYGEPSDLGIASNLEAFWDSWYAIQMDPSDSGARANVVSAAEQLAQSIKLVRGSLSSLKTNLNESIPLKIQEANSLITRLSELNTQIVKAEAAGSTTSLKDERTRLANELVQLINPDYYEDDRGVATIAVNGVILVSESESSLLEAKLNTDSGEVKHDIYLKDTLRTVDITGGEVYGLISSRDDVITNFIDKMDEIGLALIDNVNQLHRQGYDLNGNLGINFFEGTNSNDIKVNDLVSRDPSLLAASTTISNVEGNGNNALLISKLRDVGIFDSDTTAINQYYHNMISDLGINSLESQNYVEANNDIVKQLEKQIAEVSGVSIDEEMADMVKYQHSYQAIAKYLSVIQQILDTIVNLV